MHCVRRDNRGLSRADQKRARAIAFRSASRRSKRPPPRAASGGGRTSEAMSGRGLALWFVANAMHRHFLEDFVEQRLLLHNVRYIHRRRIRSQSSIHHSRRPSPGPSLRSARPLPALGGVVKYDCQCSSDPESTGEFSKMFGYADCPADV